MHAKYRQIKPVNRATRPKCIIQPWTWSLQRMQKLKGTHERAWPHNLTLALYGAGAGAGAGISPLAITLGPS